ncbi:MAG: helix-turn-helix domain-containing protein [Cytophagaceae bacterium]|nr:MAG: helix-turn-helix domain-containing protein [Cytophagaceae bacterium]
MEQNMAEGSLEQSLRSLARGIERTVGVDNSYQHLGSVHLFRAFEPFESRHVLRTPMLCVVAQGCKEAIVGGERFVYRPGDMLLNSIPVPTKLASVHASLEQPCLWLSVELPPSLIESVIAEAGLVRSFAVSPIRAMNSTPIDLEVLDALGRLVPLFGRPESAPFLLPLLLREIVYRLLVGEQGLQLRQIALVDSFAHPVLRAVEWINRNFDKPLVIQNLAREAGMSPSSLHEHFKAMTGLTPLQYQRQMRLHEAQRLMVKEGLDAANSGYRVGYGDASHFSRDYRRFFGTQVWMAGRGTAIAREDNYCEIDPDVVDKFGIPVLRFNYKWAPDEYKQAKHMQETFKEIMHNMGAVGAVYKGADTGYGLEAPGKIIHEVGTIRMGDNPKKSALNKWCQAHDCKNLFVVDAAPFVQQGDKNATWTILALSMRTAEYIIQQRKKLNV